MMQSSSSSWSWWWWCRRWKKVIAVLCTVVGPFYGLVAPLDNNNNNNNSNNESIITVLQWLQRLWKNPGRRWRWTQSNNDNSSEIKNSVVVCANERHPNARSFGLPHLRRNFKLSAVFFFFLRSFSLSACSLYFGDLVKHFQLRASRASSSFFLDRTTQQKRIIIVIAVTKTSERESELVRRRSMGDWILALTVRASILAGYMNNLLCCKKLQEVLLFLNYCISSLLLLLFPLESPMDREEYVFFSVNSEELKNEVAATFVNFRHHLLCVNRKMASSMGWCKKRWHQGRCKCDKNRQCQKIDCWREKVCLLWCFFLVFSANRPVITLLYPL